MNNQWNRLALSFGTALVVTCLVTPTTAQGSQDEGDEQGIANDGEIPTVLVDEPEDDVESPVCSFCLVEDVKRDDGTEESDTATLEILFDNGGDDAQAEIQTTVLLFDGEYRTITIPSVDLADGESYEFQLPSGDDWIWEEVCFTWVEVR